MDRLTTLTVTLPSTVLALDEVLQTMVGKLTRFHLMVSVDDRGRPVLTLTLETDDLWLATLLAMNGVAATGYLPERLVAESAQEYEARRS